MLGQDLLTRSLRNEIRHGLGVCTARQGAMSRSAAFSLRRIIRSGQGTFVEGKDSPRQERRSAHIDHSQALQPLNLEVRVNARIYILRPPHLHGPAWVPHARCRVADIVLPLSNKQLPRRGALE